MSDAIVYSECCKELRQLVEHIIYFESYFDKSYEIFNDPDNIQIFNSAIENNNVIRIKIVKNAETKIFSLKTFYVAHEDRIKIWSKKALLQVYRRQLAKMNTIEKLTAAFNCGKITKEEYDLVTNNLMKFTIKEWDF